MAPQPVDFRSLEKASTPNRWLLAPSGLCRQAEPDASPPVFGTVSEELFQALRQVVVTDLASTSEVVVDEASLGLRFTAQVPVFGFKDDVDALVLPRGEGSSTVAVYSRSRVGYGDFGVNRRRVDDLLRRLRAQV